MGGTDDLRLQGEYMLFQSLPHLRSRLVRRPIAATVAVLAVTALGAGTSPGLVTVADSELVVAPGDRVLQSVNVAMAPDGTLTGVDGTTVMASADGEQADSTSQSYSPAEVVKDLPVRVLTSYRTADGAGTDLSDLEGYTGKLQIDLTVQNLTVEPQDISYDANGSSRTQPALVGAPLTVVASAALTDTPASRVVTADANDAAAATNGVLSQSETGTTQVQWATILAPPQLASSATLSLVVDAEDFVAPAIDLSVQPGLVTDPSLGALVKTAFDPAGSQELKLQEQTIQVIGEVNTVLNRASSSISQVRRTLEASSETLGDKTVQDLEGSVVQITSSMKSLDGTVEGLGSNISSSLKATGTSSLSQLQTTVDSIDQLLGDTSANPPAPSVRGSGCDTSVATRSGGDSVYGSLLRVVSTLQGYAQASDGCKVQLKNTILTTIGPSNPNDTVCAPGAEGSPAGSVTCALSDSRSKFSTFVADLNDAAASAAGELDLTSLDDARDAVTTLAEDANAIDGLLLTLGGVVNGPDEDSVTKLVAAVRASAGKLRASRNAVGAALDTLRADLVRQQGYLTTLGSSATALVDEICALTQAPDVPVDATKPLTPAQGAGLMDNITDSPASCPQVVEQNFPAPAAGRILDTIGAARDDLAEVQTSVAATNPDGALTRALGAFDEEYTSTLVPKLGELERAINGGATGSVPATIKELQRLIRNLTGSVDGPQGSIQGIRDALDTVEDEGAAAQGSFTAAVRDVARAARKDVKETTKKAIDDVTARSVQAREDVTKAFDQSRQGMLSAAGDIAADGASTIDKQRAGLSRTEQSATTAITESVKKGLGVIADTVSASTLDTETAGKLLTADLTKVLADLGNPQVDGSGLLGSITTNAATAGTADYQLALAGRTADSYSNVRGGDIAGLMLRQAQAEAAFTRQAGLPAFQLDLPDGVERRTVYVFHLQGGA